MDGNTVPLAGDFANVPPVGRRRAKGRNSPYPFEDMARMAQASLGVPILAATEVPEGNIKSLRQYRGDPFQSDKGFIRIEMRNSQVIDDVRHGDVYLTWIDATIPGDFTSAPPPGKRWADGRNSPHPFEDMARMAQTRPGVPVLAATEVPEGDIKSLRMYRGDPFKDEKGYIRVEMRNSQVIDGVRHGDVFLTWVDTTITTASSG